MNNVSDQSPWPAPHPVIDAPYGPRYTPPAPPPVPEPRGVIPRWDLTPMAPTPRSRRWVALFTAVCLVLASGGGLLAYRFVSGSNATTAWDSRIAPLTAFVEQTTGLTFTHAVPVRYLPDSAFEKLVTQPASSMTAKERAALADEEAVGRAFGWFTGSTNVLDERNRLDSAGILAYYDFGKREIVARSNTPTNQPLPVSLRVTLVHELTHTIQDQRLDVRRLEKNATDVQAQDAITSLMEGHAVDIENTYIDSLSATDRKAYDDETAATGDTIDGRVGDVAPATSVTLDAPYVFGPALVAAAAHTKAGIEQLFVRPPVSMDQVLDPRRYFAPVEAAPLADPTLPGAWSGASVDGGTVGMLLLYLTLATAMKPAEAWHAASVWNNDVYSGAHVTDNGQVCVVWDVMADSSPDAPILRQALVTWASSRVAAAKVTVGSRISTTGEEAPIEVVLCDPGPKTAQALLGDQAVQYFYARGDTLTALIDQSGSIGAATCATEHLLTTERLDDLENPDDALRRRSDAALRACSAT
jgi:hypothetical protein